MKTRGLGLGPGHHTKCQSESSGWCLSQNMVRIQEREGNASSRLNPRLTYLSRPEQQLPEVPPNLHERLEALVSLVGTRQGHGELRIFLASVCPFSCLCFCLRSSDQHTYCLMGSELASGSVITQRSSCWLVPSCLSEVELSAFCPPVPWSSYLQRRPLWVFVAARIPPEFSTWLGYLFSAGPTPEEYL